MLFFSEYAKNYINRYAKIHNINFSFTFLRYVLYRISYNRFLLYSFSLTLIDTLDSLVILGDLEEFEHAVKLIIKDVDFDNDVVVSVFETNIRVLG